MAIQGSLFTDSPFEDLVAPTLIDYGDDDLVWDNNTYQTPPHIASYMGSLVPDGARVIDLGAGNGAISRYLPPLSVCIEIDPARYEFGRLLASQCQWVHGDVLSPGFIAATKDRFGEFDVAIANPPFVYAMQFLDAARKLLTKDGQIIFLMPGDSLLVKRNAALFSAMELKLTTKHDVIGRVAYIGPSGKPEKKRQICDSIHVFKRADGTPGGVVHVNQATCGVRRKKAS